MTDTQSKASRTLAREFGTEVEEVRHRACEYRRMADNYDYLSLCNDLQKDEIEKLKLEIEQLKAVEERNLDLQEEVETLKETLDEVRVYLSRFDGDEVEVFDKIVKGE